MLRGAVVASVICSAMAMGCLEGTNCFNGTGTRIFPGGSRYEGEWAHGNFNGRGVLQMAEGHIYKGEFVNGHRHGVSGHITYSDGKLVNTELSLGQ